LILKTRGGMIPTHLLHFDESLAVEKVGLRRHIGRSFATDGVTGTTTTAQAIKVPSDDSCFATGSLVAVHGGRTAA
jgi:hypothetical protein